ncbi:hypothetical protein VPBG_00076 [Vibrio phage helene 12B3]|uniref:hypothetical protein n=1 Tax=Vibrio phage helene 12B3 TaxID=573173 RepID=UPI0002C1450F|nr:hypothetical protein VPBG_00076 [Vibrio phage helene 12B3]YP_009222959.1 hypothetical protein VPLG_00110 [Vibrio phage eugene 12A10]AGG57848.1 hypothetical protein VPBG_00076 [Vibrio phage helene 12B3]AGN51549.1 hypothetical protein VPLG_00110 [Vibrio phage eugene 12A10]
MEFKIYTNDFTVLEKVCTDYGLTPEYIFNPPLSREPSDVYGTGYCTQRNGKLSPFSENSFVDLSEDYEDITGQYLPQKFTL